MQLNRVTRVRHQVPLRTALVSVADKTGLEEFAERLWEHVPSLVIYSTGGTYSLLQSLDSRLTAAAGSLAGPRVHTISSYTGQPEMQGGLVKTLDFRVYLSLLSEEFNADHRNDMERNGAIPFDMTVCSFYPFEETARQPGTTVEDLRTTIDIGGPTMLRASAKNFLRVLPVCRPDQYASVLAALADGKGTTSLEFRAAMATEAFRYTARYEAAIAEHLGNSLGVATLSELYQEALQ